VLGRPGQRIASWPSSSGRSGGRTEEVRSGSGKPRPQDFGESITQCGWTRQIGEAAQGRNLGRVGILERGNATFAESRNAVERRRLGPARERAGTKLEGGGCGIWPRCVGGGEDPREAETQEGSDPSQGLTARWWMRALVRTKALKAI
jgi:hypothetical protein